MATLLDMGLLEQFGGIFPFLLVLVLAYALFLRIKWFENKALAATVAFVLALMATLSPVASTAIRLMAPYYVLLLLMLFFIMLIMMTLGATSENITDYIFKPDSVGGWVGWAAGALAVIIGVWGFGKTLAMEGLWPTFAGEAAGTAQEQLFWGIIFHPKMLGLIFVMLVGLFAVNRLASGAT
ncbi:MAG: hypothetical protein ACE5FT_03165 [Candidatus Nanoarchaeia archaeon]